uniref:Uncharacterized protein n=1 Tax=Meloidogyne enterolobii TaxID=390850 RepID=A0A6V7XKH4_MELEN|nr:unnamed protein product [Meloidogyne enterolobii]
MKHFLKVILKLDERELKHYSLLESGQSTRNCTVIISSSNWT